MSDDIWQWYAGSNEEHYAVGPCPSRDDAIAQGRSNYDEGFHIIEATKCVWPAPDAETIINDMFENSDDLFGDDYPEIDGSPEEQKAAERELQDALNIWMEKWRNVIFPTPWTFAQQRNQEFIPAESAE